MAANPEQNLIQCKVCREPEPSFIHTMFKSGGFRRLCTNCLLKENGDLFCPVCLEVFVGGTPRQNKRCFTCSAVIHLTCVFPSASSSTFICDACKDPRFFFFPKSFVPGSDESGDDTLKVECAKALLAAAKIAEASVNIAALTLRREAMMKISESSAAKARAKEALEILHEIVATEEKSKKRKESDR